MDSVLVFGVVLVAFFYGVSLYNNLVAVSNAVNKAWANVDVLLKQRHDELPKLVAVCKQYQQFEQSMLLGVIQARAAVQVAGQSGDMNALGRAETGLRSSIGRVFALAEAYPDLKTNQTFLQLQNRISALESSISDRREFYNASVNINNVVRESFPDILIARLFGFTKKSLLEFSSAETADNAREVLPG